MARSLRVVPAGIRDANRFVLQHHRHHAPVTSPAYRFALAVVDGEGVVRGVAILGRPSARALDRNDEVIEVLRVATDGTDNACSALYGAAARTAKGLGYSRIITYILDVETGTSLRAAGWFPEAQTKGRAWERSDGVRRNDHPLGDKWRWGRVLAEPHGPIGWPTGPDDQTGELF